MTGNTTQMIFDMASDRNLVRDLSYIGGRWTGSAGSETISVFNPADMSVIASVASLSAAEALTAVDHADSAFRGWSALLPQERSKILRNWFDLIVENREDLARIMVMEQGKPISEARGEIDYAASFVEFYAEESKRPNI